MRFEKYNYGGFEFACRGWETSRAWGHEVYMFDGVMEVAKARVRYYNRTWEAFRFQSAMLQAVDNYEKEELKHYIRDYKIEMGLLTYDSEHFTEIEKPLPRGRKKQLEEAFKKSDKGQRIETVKNEIMGR